MAAGARVRRWRAWVVSALVGLSALSLATLAVATNLATSALPAAWRHWTSDPRLVWSVTGGLTAITVTLAVVLQRISGDWENGGQKSVQQVTNTEQRSADQAECTEKVGQAGTVPDGQTIAVGLIDSALHYSAAPTMRSGWRDYLEQVRDIAPRHGLRDRDSELSRMADFCQGSESYWWWQAEAWAGKSALMSSFVLKPPVDTVVVSFFVTARYASQDNGEAFTAAVVSQLEELIEHDPAEHAGAVRLGGRYRWLLRAVAQQAASQGKRLVLVVDGLDEDRGAETRLPSIACLLPKWCEDGMKVIVASRPFERFPLDVPPDHPLRNPGIVRPLSRSEHAEVIRDTAELELRELLNATPAHRDLLGLITAAYGGLTLTDLEELTGLTPYDIRLALSGVTGRSFMTRPEAWASPQGASRVYLLAHEMLHTEATGGLGEQCLAHYRGRLHAWALAYQSRGWPAGTPIFLLRGYFRLLQATEDVPRLVASATDEARHERMLAISGGDAAALNEIAAVADVILSHPRPDLTVLARLAFYRDNLVSRNEYIPVRLPALWAAIGEHERATALARSIPDLDERVQALVMVAVAMTTTGMPNQGAAMAAEAGALVSSVTSRSRQALLLPLVAEAMVGARSFDQAAILADQAAERASALPPDEQVYVLVQVAAVMEAAGMRDRAADLIDRAEVLARTVPNSFNRDFSLALVAGTMGLVGRHDHAEAVAQAIADPRDRVEALSRVGAAMAAAGMRDRTAAVAKSAETTARIISHPQAQAKALAKAGAVMAAAGMRDRAADVLNEAEALGCPIYDRFAESQAFDTLLEIVNSRMPDHAVALAQLGDPVEQVKALSKIAAAMAVGGMREQATAIAGQAEGIAHAIDDPEQKADGLTSVAESLVVVGLNAQAEAIAMQVEASVRTIYAADDRTEALAIIAEAMAAAGMGGQASVIANQAEAMARTINDVDRRGHALAAAAGAMVAVGMCDQAVAVADQIAALAYTTDLQYGTARTVAQALAAMGFYDHAQGIAYSLDSPLDQAELLSFVAEAMAAAGMRDLTIPVARQVEALNRVDNHLPDDRRTWALGPVVRAKAAAGMYDSAEILANSINEPWRQSLALAAVAETMAAAGMHERALRIARSIPYQMERAEALAKLAKVLASSGIKDQAAALATQAEALACSLAGHPQQAPTLAVAAKAMAAAGMHDRAENLAYSINDPDQQAEALTSVAAAMTVAGQTERGQLLLALALSTGSWKTVLREHPLPPEPLGAIAALLLDGTQTATGTG